MRNKILCCVLAAVLCAPLSTAVSASWTGNGFIDYGGYTETSTEYTFNTEESVMVFAKEVLDDYDYYDADIVYAGSDLYVPIYAFDTTADSPTEIIATDKQVKTDNIQVSYKALQGRDCVDSVSLVSGKKEKIKDLPAGMYAKVSFTRTYFQTGKTKLSIRLVLSVNGVSYQDTAVTFGCNFRNRQESIDKNSVYGALSPAQFKASSRYNGEASFDFGDNIKYTGRVSNGRQYILSLDRSVDTTIKEMYPDAYLEYYNFRGDNDTFSSVGTLEIPINQSKFKEKKTRAEVYAYEVVGNRLTALTKDDISYNAKTGKVYLETQTLGNYLLSSRALMRNLNGSSEEDILRSGYAEDVADTEQSSSASSTK